MTTARELFDQADLILLDFDGPVTRLLPPPKNTELATLAKGACLAAGMNLSPKEEENTDHLMFIRAAARHSDGALASVETLCTDGEIEAAATSPITPGVVELLEAADNQDKAVVVVTNNSPECVERFLRINGLTPFVTRILGRNPRDPTLMKPNPHILKQALAARYQQAVMIGDSVSDIEAAIAAGVPAVGLAKNEARARELSQSGAAVIVTTMLDVM